MGASALRVAGCAHLHGRPGAQPATALQDSGAASRAPPNLTISASNRAFQAAKASGVTGVPCLRSSAMRCSSASRRRRSSASGSVLGTARAEAFSCRAMGGHTCVPQPCRQSLGLQDTHLAASAFAASLPLHVTLFLLPSRTARLPAAAPTVIHSCARLMRV